MSISTVDALKVKYNDTVFYVALIKAKKLFSIAKISRADDDPEKGYQRLLGVARAKKIAEYLRDGNVIPGALILSAGEGVIKSYDTANKKLKLEERGDSFLVIDGQHRLYGAEQYEKDIPIPVCIFENLTKPQEVQYFLDINGTQRGVPKALQLELTKFTAEPESKEDLMIKLFDFLENEPSSPLCGKMSRTRSIAGKLSHVPFQNSLGVILEKSPLNTLNFEQKTTMLINYLSAVESILVEEYGVSKKLSNAAFFQAIMGVFIDACNLSILKHKDYKESSFKSILKPLSDIDLEHYSGTNRKSINELTGLIRQKISVVGSLSDDLF